MLFVPPTDVKLPPMLIVPPAQEIAGEGNARVFEPELPVTVKVPPVLTVIAAGEHACPVSV